MINHDDNDERLDDAYGSGGSWVSLLIGLLIGGLVGAVAMLLLAPQSGKRTRARIQRESNELREHTADTVDDAMAQARVQTHRVSRGVRKQAGELEQRGHAVLDGNKGS
jgi:gas vesicle protein